jgi:hypothetical protein
MGEIRRHAASLLIAAIVSQFPDVRQFARERLARLWGEPSLVSSEFEFVETRYYQQSMGTDLIKQFLVYSPPEFDAAGLADWKLASNILEEEIAQTDRYPVLRPLNIDPGYLTEAKLVLATTKDRDHRIYLRDGIFAEVTLHWHHGQWAAQRWTYPDYQRADFQLFFTECRNLLRDRQRRAPTD